MASRATKIEPKKAVTSDPDVTVESGAAGGVTETDIARRAYELWTARGCPIGSDQEDWFNAERELREQKGQPSRAA